MKNPIQSLDDFLINFKMELLFFVIILSGLLNFNASAADNTVKFTKTPYVVSIKSDSATVMWELNRPEKTYLELSNADNGKLKKIVPVKISAPESFKRSSGCSGILYKAVIEKIKPGVIYKYRIAAGGKIKTLWYKLSVPSTKIKHFTFAACGDTRSKPEKYRTLAEMILKTKPAFVINTGDIVCKGKNLQEWDDQFFKPGSLLTNSVPLYVARGGYHDWTPAFAYYFGLNIKKTYYSFEYGNAYFAILDINADTDKKVLAKEKLWLSDELKKSKAVWKIAVFHEPPFSSCVRHGSSIWIRREFQPILSAGKVDLVLNGHDHTYSRTHPLKTDKSSKGTVFIVTGCAKEKTVTLPYQAKTAGGVHFILFDVEAESIHGRCINLKGETLDKFTITKAILSGKKALSETFLKKKLFLTSAVSPDPDIFPKTWMKEKILKMFDALITLQEKHAVMALSSEKVGYYRPEELARKALALSKKIPNLSLKSKNKCIQISELCNKLKNLKKTENAKIERRELSFRIGTLLSEVSKQEE